MNAPCQLDIGKDTFVDEIQLDVALGDRASSEIDRPNLGTKPASRQDAHASRGDAVDVSDRDGLTSG